MSIAVKCIPSSYYASIYEIPYDQLKKQGIKSLFFDLDNTIISYDETMLSEQSIAFLNKLSEDFNVLVISNSGYNRVSHALSQTNLPYVWHSKKPLKFGFKKALKMTSSSIKETMLIGDQLMTDVFGGNRMGLSVILVQAVKRKSDRWMTKINRVFERIVLKNIQKKHPKLYEERLLTYVRNQEM